MKRKNKNKDLKRFYTSLLETGLIGSLAILIIAANIDFASTNHSQYYENEPAVPVLEEIPITKAIETPPVPPRPPVPVPVPDDYIIEDVDIDLYPNLDLGNRFDDIPPEQQPEEDEDYVFEFVEHMPELIGGLASIQENIRYPEKARRAGIEGRVYVQFVVNERGEVEDPHVVRGIGGGADEEALRAVKEAKFRPGMQRGRPVRVQYNLPIIFRLQN